MQQMMIGHRKVLAWFQTEVQSQGPCGIVLVQYTVNEWVTAWYRQGDSEWVYGHYISNFDEASVDFLKRVEQHRPKQVPVPQQPRY